MGIRQEEALKVNWNYESGEKNQITDVPGVLVGQTTLRNDREHIFTGVTAVLPHGGNLFRDKVTAGCAVINGFGKTAGLVQVEELGTIEAPVIITNTFGVGTCLNGTIRYMLEQNPEIGTLTGTVNCVVAECNDGSLSDIRGMHVKEEHVISAIREASDTVQEGCVGAGTGMICMGLKGGVGTASRRVLCDQREYTIGALVVTNFGMEGRLRIDGKPMTQLEPAQGNGSAGQQTEKGSVIILLATDIPLSDRQCKRLAKRSVVSLARTGSFLGNGSGDIAIAFSTGNRIPHFSKQDLISIVQFQDAHMDKLFEAAAETVEDAVLSSLYHGETIEGIRGKKVYGLKEFL